MDIQFDFRVNSSTFSILIFLKHPNEEIPCSCIPKELKLKPFLPLPVSNLLCLSPPTCPRGLQWAVTSWTTYWRNPEWCTRTRARGTSISSTSYWTERTMSCSSRWTWRETLRNISIWSRCELCWWTNVVSAVTPFAKEQRMYYLSGELSQTQHCQWQEQLESSDDGTVNNWLHRGGSAGELQFTVTDWVLAHTACCHCA